MQLRGFVVAVLELLRRIQWNSFRVESEHLGNLDAYRITRTIALPYLTAPRIDASLSDDSQLAKSFGQRVFASLHEMNRSICENLAPAMSLLPRFNFGDKEAMRANGMGSKARGGKGKRKESLQMKRERTKRSKSNGTVAESSSFDEDDDDEEDEDSNDEHGRRAR